MIPFILEAFIFWNCGKLQEREKVITGVVSLIKVY